MNGIMTKRKGQGALEYLIIIAAVLAIAAVVVAFLMGAFESASSDVEECRTAASRCGVELTAAIGATCPFCDEPCAAGKAVGSSLADPTCADPLACTALETCKLGESANLITPP